MEILVFLEKYLHERETFRQEEGKQLCRSIQKHSITKRHPSWMLFNYSMVNATQMA